MLVRVDKLGTWQVTACAVGLIALGAAGLLGCSGDSARTEHLQPDAQALVTALKRIRPDARVGEPHGTPVPGVFGLDVGGGNVVYGTTDGTHIFAGDLYAVDSRLTNLTEQRREARRSAVLAGYDVSKTVASSRTSLGRQSVCSRTSIAVIARECTATLVL